MTGRRPARARARAAAVALLAAGAGLAACESPQVPACPGAVVGTFRFTATQVGDGCLYDPSTLPDTSVVPPAPPAPKEFTAQVSFGAAGEAWVCPQAVDAAPLAGSHVGDHFTVSGGGQVYAAGCSCTHLDGQGHPVTDPLQVAESLEGDVTRAGTGEALGVTGGLLRDDVTGANGAVCEPNPPSTEDETCGVPCTVQWSVTGAP